MGSEANPDVPNVAWLEKLAAVVMHNGTVDISPECAGRLFAVRDQLLSLTRERDGLLAALEHIEVMSGHAEYGDPTIESLLFKCDCISDLATNAIRAAQPEKGGE